MVELKVSLKSSKDSAPSPDGIYNDVIRHLFRKSLSAPLTYFNDLWSDLFFPFEWKRAGVVPLLKTGKDPFLPPSWKTRNIV